MTITHSVTYVIDGEVRTVAVYDDAPVPFARDRGVIIDLAGGTHAPVKYLADTAEDKR